MKEFISKFIAQFRAAIAKLPVAESIDANGEAAWALRALTELGVRVDVQFPALAAGMESSAVEAEVMKAFDKVLGEAGTVAVANAETAGTHIPKTAHELAIANAKETAKGEARQEFEKVAADNAEAAKQREVLVAAGLPKEIAEKVPSTVLVGDQAESSIATITGRVKAVLAIPGFKPETGAEIFSDCCESLDEAGTKRFDRMISLAKSAGVSKEAAAAEAESKKPPGNPAELPAGRAQEKPVRRIV